MVRKPLAPLNGKITTTLIIKVGGDDDKKRTPWSKQ